MVTLKPADTVGESNLTIPEQLRGIPFASLFGDKFDAIEPATANYDPELQLELCPNSREPVNKIISRPDGTLTIAPENYLTLSVTYFYKQSVLYLDLDLDDY